MVAECVSQTLKGPCDNPALRHDVRPLSTRRLNIWANLCFGGRHRNRLFMCGSTSVFSLFVNTQGAPGG